MQTWSHPSTLTAGWVLWVFEALIFLWEVFEALIFLWEVTLEVSAGQATLLLELHPLAHLVSLDQPAKL